MTSSRLRVFVSSKMQELAPERLAIKSALDELKIDGWVFEFDAGARPQTIQQTYKEEVENADLYIGLFWKGYGDYTIEEYEHARKLGKDCFIYEKRAEIDGQRDPRLEVFLKELGSVETGLTPKWFNEPDELKELVKQDVARWQAEIVRRYKVSGAPLAYRKPQPAEENIQKELSILLNKVEQFWIKGVLGHSVYHQVLIELGKKKMAEAVEHPWETVLELPHEAHVPILSNRRITDIFEDVGRYLLILGEPGSGKTTTMLELARDLITQARKDQDLPIPTVFNLSSWADKRHPLADWMAEELKAKYQVPKQIGRYWLDQHRILPLLDGLDEVNLNIQSACVEAINNFVQEYPSGLIVCSRLQEYTSLPARLKLNGAICLQPLSVQQTDEYLIKAGPELDALRAALRDDQNLQDLIKSPLMLNVMCLAYQNQPIKVLANTNLETIDSRRKQVFDMYIERMLERKGKQFQHYTQEKLKLWLRWLAQKLLLHSHSIFLIEQLQPSWLSTRLQQIGYLLLSRLSAGLFLGVGAGLPIGLVVYMTDSHDVKWLLGVEETGNLTTVLKAWLASSIAGLLLGLLTGFVDILTVKLNQKYKIITEVNNFQYSILSIAIYIAVYVVLWLAFWLILWFFEEPSSSNLQESVMTISSMSLLLGIAHWFILGARASWQNARRDILTVERLTWTWSSAFKAGVWWAAITFIVLLPIYAIIEKNQYDFDESVRVSDRERMQAARTELATIDEELENNPRLTSDQQRRNILETRKGKLLSAIEHYKESTEQTDSRFLTVITMPLVLSALGGLAGFLIGGFTNTLTTGKTSPNQGIKLSIRNAAIGGIKMGAISALIFNGIMIFFTYDYTGNLMVGMLLGFMPALVVGLSTSVFFGFRYGGYDVIKHYVLRAILYYKGHIPKQYASVLNYAATLVLLQKVGGGYIFIHRLLLEHFATMDTIEGESTVSN